MSRKKKTYRLEYWEQVDGSLFKRTKDFKAKDDLEAIRTADNLTNGKECIDVKLVEVLYSAGGND